MGQSATNAEEKASRPTRQTGDDGISLKGQKAKRYRCYLVDDDDVNVDEEIDDQHNGKIIKKHEGKSFFAGFQRDRDEKNGNNILGGILEENYLFSYFRLGRTEFWRPKKIGGHTIQIFIFGKEENNRRNGNRKTNNWGE